jgi:predicted transcriptional regulator of viral defense system
MLVIPIRRALKGKTAQNILLSVASLKQGNIDRDWKVDINVIKEEKPEHGII